MADVIRWFFLILGRAILALRYRVEVTGLDSVRGMHKALILPNHPGYMDPPLVVRTLWPTLKPRPMLLASVFRNPLIFWLPKLLNAVQMPDLEHASAEARLQAEASMQTVIAGLKAGHNHILWPSGRVYRQAHESLGAARSVSEILLAVPDVQIILVRTRGLWGSRFTWAYTGHSPKLGACLLRGMGILLANLLFLTPRRRISITVERIDPARLPGLTREQLNPFLEAWYNAPGDETPVYVPYHFLLGPRSYQFPKLDGSAELDLSQVKPATRDTVADIVADKFKRDPGPSERDPSTLLETLGMDSLERMEVSLEIERRFGFSGSEVPTTIGSLWALAEGMVKGAQLPPVPSAWFKTPDPKRPLAMLSDTMARAFVERCLVSGPYPAAADDASGVVTYERLLVAARLLSRRFARYPEPNVGILLPASVAADTVFFALHLAGKLPVILNFTTGPANLAHAASVMGLKHVITSRRFVDRTGISVEGAQYVHLEELRKGIGKLESLTVLLANRFAANALRSALPRQNPDDPCVVLFTSGSEKAPKAVPLTHRNILSNIQAALDAFHVTHADSLIGFLPPFHSFGVTVTMVLPILTGARVVHHPDPTDAAAIARKVAAYRPTLLCATPTFISYILDRAKPGDLDCLRLLVAGAEKCPDAVFDKGRRVAPNATVIEGYGITECSPIIAINRPERLQRGSVGLPLENLKLRVVDVNDHHPLPSNEVGMLLVHGPSVFPGYIGSPADSPDPFLQQDGLQWYLTGDLVRIDQEGFIWFAGRLKRFIKAGGEMISLPAIEEPFILLYPPTDKGPRIAVEGVELSQGRKIVLFSTVAITLREANEVLQRNGIRGIMRLDEVRRIETIPILGTGKTDYKLLRQQITAQ